MSNTSFTTVASHAETWGEGLSEEEKLRMRISCTSFNQVLTWGASPTKADCATFVQTIERESPAAVEADCVLSAPAAQGSCQPSEVDGCGGEDQK